MDANNLAKTLQTWNDDVNSTGQDSAFGKTFGLKPIKTAPYYAVKVVEYNLGAIGGLRINRKSQVLNTQGEVIPHRYAGGQVAGDFMGPYYPGAGVAATVYFGKLASDNAINETALS